MSPEQKKLCESCVPLAIGTANSFCDSMRSRGVRLNRDEYVSAALLGLCEAAKSFNPGKGTHITTWVKVKVTSRLRDFVRNEIRYRERFSQSACERLHERFKSDTSDN